MTDETRAIIALRKELKLARMHGAYLYRIIMYIPKTTVNAGKCACDDMKHCAYSYFEALGAREREI